MGHGGVRGSAAALKSFHLVNAAHGKPNHATEIRKHAATRAGELLAEMKERGERHTADKTQNLGGVAGRYSRNTNPHRPRRHQDAILALAEVQPGRVRRSDPTHPYPTGHRASLIGCPLRPAVPSHLLARARVAANPL